MAKRAEQQAASGGERRRAWLIGLALLCCYSYFFYLGGNWNVESHYAQAWALAEHHSLVIDDYPWLPPGGGDAARFEGHYYSDKLIGPSLLAAPSYKIFDLILGGAGFDSNWAAFFALRLTNIAANALPSALLGALLYLFLAELGLSASLRVWLAFAYGLGTLALPYSTVFFGHQLSAVALAGAFMLLWRAGAAGRQTTTLRLRSEQASPPYRTAAAGALAGFAAISDAMGMFAAAALGLYAVWLAVRPGQDKKPPRLPFSHLFAFVVVALAVFAVQLAANWWSFGRPLAFPHLYHAQAAFRARHTAGFFGLHLPKLYPLYQLSLGPWRGLFFGSPVLLLALPGCYLLALRKWRAEAMLLTGSWLLVLLLSAGYENWTTGSAYGPRYQIVVLPFLLIALAPAAARWPLVFKALTVLSIAAMVVVTAQSPFRPEDIRNPLAQALIEFSRGNLQHGNLGLLLGLPGITSLLPLALVEAAVILGLKRAR